jgi:hypothetical protein
MQMKLGFMAQSALSFWTAMVAAAAALSDEETDLMPDPSFEHGIIQGDLRWEQPAWHGGEYGL